MEDGPPLLQSFCVHIKTSITINDIGDKNYMESFYSYGMILVVKQKS